MNVGALGLKAREVSRYWLFPFQWLSVREVETVYIVT